MSTLKPSSHRERRSSSASFRNLGARDYQEGRDAFVPVYAVTQGERDAYVSGYFSASRRAVFSERFHGGFNAY